MALLMRQKKPAEDSILMGLEKLGLSVFPGCETKMEIPIKNNQYNLSFKDKKQQQEFENFFGVKFESPEGQEFLSNYQVSLSHDVTAYDMKNPKDAFDLHILKVNGGMGLVATNEAELENTPIDTFKFIVTDEHAEVEERVKSKESKIQAMAELNRLKESGSSRLILIAKYIFGVTQGIGNNRDVAFDRLYDYVDGNYQNALKFSEIAKMDPAYLSTVVSIRDAIYRNIIRFQNGQYVLFATQTPMGRNEDELIRFLTNPQNSDVLGTGLKDDSPTSILAQLKQYD